MMTRFIAAASLAAALVAAPAAAQTARLPVKDYDVFVDPPTGFVFVKLPQGWKFAGNVDSAAVERLPPTVLTWLLPPEADDALRMVRARREAAPGKAGKS